jgi:CheY-like chemotaxis protein
VGEVTGTDGFDQVKILEVHALELPASAHGGSWPCAACGRSYPIEAGWLVAAFGPTGRLDLIVCPDCATHAEKQVAGPRTVLVADDDPDFRGELRDWLERDGIFAVVAETGDGSEVAGAVEEHEPDLVLLDLRLPHQDGLEVLGAMAERSDPPMVVMLTAFPTRDAQALAERLGSRLFLDKHTSRATGLVVQLLDA